MVKRTRSGQVKNVCARRVAVPSSKLCQKSRGIYGVRSSAGKAGGAPGPVYATYHRPWLTIHGIEGLTQRNEENDRLCSELRSSTSATRRTRSTLISDPEPAESIITVYRPPTPEVSKRESTPADESPPEIRNACAAGESDKPVLEVEIGILDRSNRSTPALDSVERSTEVADHVANASVDDSEEPAVSDGSYGDPQAKLRGSISVLPSYGGQWTSLQRPNNGSIQQEERTNTPLSNEASMKEEIDRSCEPSVTHDYSLTPKSPSSTFSDVFMPGPYLSQSCSPQSSASEPGSPAAEILKTYPRITPANEFVSALTRKNASEMSTDQLYRLAVSAQEALVAWQTEYLYLDRRTAPHSLPFPKKPATGGRLPLPQAVHQDRLEAELYGYTFDPKKIGHQDPWMQRSRRQAGEGRDLRRMLADKERFTGLLGISEDDTGAGSGVEYGKRERIPVRRWDGVEVMRTKEGSAGARADGTPETEVNWPGSGRKRRRPGLTPLHQRVRNIREQYAVTEPDTEEERSYLSQDFGDRETLATPLNQFDPGTIDEKRRTDIGNSPRETQAKPAKFGKARVKSVKRSQSMTLWWAKRKKRAADEKMKAACNWDAVDPAEQEETTAAKE